MNEEFVPIGGRLYDELDAAQRSALDRQVPVEPTEDEARNGWTTETLTEYVASRAAGQSLSADPHSLHRRLAERATEQNHRYNPHRWRG